MEQVRIELSERGVIVETSGADGDVEVKAVDPVELSRAFAGDVIMDTGWLGPRIHRFAQTGGIVRLLVEDPPQRRTLKPEIGRPIEGVPTPRCLWNFGLRNGRLESTRMVACAERVPPGMEWIPTDASPVARFPFPNVFLSTAVCWGRVNLPAVTLQTICGIVNVFWASKFNHDLEGIGLPGTWRSNACPRGSNLFRAISQEMSFPQELLVPFGTLGQWWRGEVGR